MDTTELTPPSPPSGHISIARLVAIVGLSATVLSACVAAVGATSKVVVEWGVRGQQLSAMEKAIDQKADKAVLKHIEDDLHSILELLGSRPHRR